MGVSPMPRGRDTHAVKSQRKTGSSRASDFVLGMVLALTAASLCGCTAASVAAYKVMGPPDVKAKYVPTTRPAVVLVEDYRRASTFTDDELLSRCVEREVRDHLPKTPLVDSIKIRELKLAKADAFAAMSVAQIGRAVGAEQIIWVDVTQNATEAILGGEQIRGTVAARVKVVDAFSGQTLWPSDMAEGYPLSFAIDWGTSTPRTGQQVRDALLHGLGDKIARLFYTWKPEQEEPEGFTVKD
jgi:hypothetical protein